MTRTTRRTMNPPTIHRFDLPNDALFPRPSTVEPVEIRKHHAHRQLIRLFLVEFANPRLRRLLPNRLVRSELEELSVNGMRDYVIAHQYEAHQLDLEYTYIRTTLLRLKQIIQQRDDITNDLKHQLMRFIDLFLGYLSHIQTMRGGGRRVKKSLTH